MVPGMSQRGIRLLAGGTCAIALLLGGCGALDGFSQTYQRGYVLPEGALEQIPLGATQEQVLIVLGTPSTVATVSGEAAEGAEGWGRRTRRAGR